MMTLHVSPSAGICWAGWEFAPTKYNFHRDLDRIPRIKEKRCDSGNDRHTIRRVDHAVFSATRRIITSLKSLNEKYHKNESKNGLNKIGTAVFHDRTGKLKLGMGIIIQCRSTKHMDING